MDVIQYCLITALASYLVYRSIRFLNSTNEKNLDYKIGAIVDENGIVMCDSLKIGRNNYTKGDRVMQIELKIFQVFDCLLIGPGVIERNINGVKIIAENYGIKPNTLEAVRRLRMNK